VQRSLWLAVWQAGQVTQLGHRATTKGGRLLVERMSSLLPVPVEAIPFDGPVVLDMLWSAFFATGDPVYVERIVGALELLIDDDQRRVAIGQSAMWSLAANRDVHPIVKATCELIMHEVAHLDRLTVGGVVREALTQIANAPAAPTTGLP